MTPETLTELRRLLDCSSKLPWECYRPHFASGYHSITASDGQTVAVEAGEYDAELIAAAINALPALLDAADERDGLRTYVDELRGERDAVYAAMVKAHAALAQLRADRGVEAVHYSEIKPGDTLTVVQYEGTDWELTWRHVKILRGMLDHRATVLTDRGEMPIADQTITLYREPA